MTARHAAQKARHATYHGHRIWRLPVVGAWMVALLLLGLGSGTAFAYYTATGSGTGRAAVGKLQAVGLAAATGTPADDLYPGGSADLRVTITNPNAFPVTIVGIAQDAAGRLSVTGGHGCKYTNAEVSVATNTSPVGTPGLSLAPTTTTTLTIETGVAMGTTSPTGCQGASFDIPLTVTVHS